ncbi:MAG: hypothetical protein M3O94_08775 [Actinomycetota bacterium]|nr:hypothetical protein [Actinomycetota bacterium]
MERYADPSRVYHDLRHLEDVLRRFDVLVGECADPLVVELAAWFHDSVYDVRRTDNEQASADRARALLAPYLSADEVDEVARLVLLTRDHEVDAGDANGAVLCDADLAILASGSAAYDDYTERVRREYAHVSDQDFRIGRGDVLRRLLDLPNLFHTSYGLRNWEVPARANLRRELTTL